MVDKMCTKCRTVQPIEHFAGDQWKKSGHKSQCKKCDATIHRAKYAAGRGGSVRRYRRPTDAA